MKKSGMKVEYISIDSVIPYAANAKVHNAEQIEQIKESITLFGFNDPIAIDEDGVIIEGHGRIVAAKELGMKEVPVIVLAGLSEEQKKAYRLVHNKLTMNTDFSIDVLNEQLLNITDIDMSRFSFLSGDESFFDPDVVHEPKNLGAVIVTVEKETGDEVREYLNSNLIDFKEKDVR